MQQNIDNFFASFMRKVQTFQERIPDIVATEAINATVDNFRDESYFGEKWKPRKDKKNTRRLLVKTSTLQRSPRVFVSQPGLVIIGTEVPYASIHNNGGTINRAARSETFVRNRYKTGKKGKMFGGMGAFRKGTTQGQGQTYKAYAITMPMRKFLGPHPKLKQRILNVIQEEYIKVFK